MCIRMGATYRIVGSCRRSKVEKERVPRGYVLAVSRLDEITGLEKGAKRVPKRVPGTPLYLYGLPHQRRIQTARTHPTMAQWCAGHLFNTFSKRLRLSLFKDLSRSVNTLSLPFMRQMPTGITLVLEGRRFAARSLALAGS